MDFHPWIGRKVKLSRFQTFEQKVNKCLITGSRSLVMKKAFNTPAPQLFCILITDDLEPVT